MARNLVNLNSVTKGYGSRTVLHDVTLGVSEATGSGSWGQRRGQVDAAAADRRHRGAR